ncbi:hypothetical protein NDU88_002391 [Pleurodeles waltl]|uniref:Uncharacterized protein n=1 Tax=Pleurodeles waltl TaxID=8319 RepID=A0AAV7M0E9_PLEWA|nr:hypothetical protein NDU88_002391 [Pleurodeles waltl]
MCMALKARALARRLGPLLESLIRANGGYLAQSSGRRVTKQRHKRRAQKTIRYFYREMVEPGAAGGLTDPEQRDGWLVSQPHHAGERMKILITKRGKGSR